MTRQFDAAVAVGLEIERELRLLTPDRPSLRCFIAECLNRADATYPAVEEIKSRLENTGFEKTSGTGAYIRNVTREIASGRLPEPPARERIGRMDWNQKDEAVLELGGRPEKLFLLLVIAAEIAYQRNADAFGTVEDLAAHKAQIAELQAKRASLHKRFPSTWGHNDWHIGRVTSDGAALITFAKAPGEVPLHPPETAGARLIEYLLRQEVDARSKAA
ncbi:MAG: hypothetical protein ACR2M4_07960 [Actinomycetota bacterium]